MIPLKTNEPNWHYGRPPDQRKRLTMPPFLYLLNLCHAMDDVPMAIFDTLEDAMAAAVIMSWDVPAGLTQRLELPECSTPCCITVTTFHNGKPISRVVVRDYDSETDGLDV